ncbi:hypothetical protein RUND412_004546 [Rhizina undulata]
MPPRFPTPPHPLSPLSLLSILFLLLLLLPPTLANTNSASAALFCKCTCFKNSTIIPLSGSDSGSGFVEGGGGGNCNDCNRQFCIGYNLPICREAKEEDVLATCFQRDSIKDKTVVFIFIFATVGLLGYALVRPWVAKWIDIARNRRYTPLAT